MPVKCPKCGSKNIVKNGSIHNKKKKHMCKDSSSQFVDDPQNKISDERR